MLCLPALASLSRGERDKKETDLRLFEEANSHGWQEA